MGDFCTACYNTHRTNAEKQRCAQAQAQSDAAQNTMRRDFAKRYADRCHWCGGTHLTKAERAQCMLDNCG
jgi:hypothetical protein